MDREAWSNNCQHRHVYRHEGGVVWSGVELYTDSETASPICDPSCAFSYLNCHYIKWPEQPLPQEERCINKQITVRTASISHTGVARLADCAKVTYVIFTSSRGYTV